MLHPDSALKMILEEMRKPQTERVPIVEALGRVLAEQIVSTLDSPPFAKSAMDGYAVCREDSSHSFQLLESIAAGKVPTQVVRPGQCSKIMTGAMMPEGAGKVIRVEYTEEKDGRVTQLQPDPYGNVIQRGENLKKGDPVLAPRVLQPQDIGVLASLGIEEVLVALRPLVGVINTGSELRNPGEKLKAGEIYNSNGAQLCAQIASAGARYRYYGIIEDEPPELRAAITKAFADCDMVLITGGVSMGDYDYVPEVLEENGVRIRFHKLAVKPGKPTLFGQKDDTFVFGLPGNPVSTFVIFEVFVKPLLFRLTGIDYVPPRSKGRLAKPIKRRSSERVEFRPVQLRGDEVHPIKYHGSAHLDALSQTNGLVRIEIGVELIDKGAEIDVRQI